MGWQIAQRNKRCSLHSNSNKISESSPIPNNVENQRATHLMMSGSNKSLLNLVVAEHHHVPILRKSPGYSNTNPSRSTESSAINELAPCSKLSKRYRPPEGVTSKQV